jgi:hypothetical protein
MIARERTAREVDCRSVARQNHLSANAVPETNVWQDINPQFDRIARADGVSRQEWLD